jgi:tetratricopeptide (TPR) repeat protein
VNVECQNPTMHPLDLWDFDDPAGSERRFREAADAADGDQRAIWLTQLARALGLQERYDEGFAVLDGIPRAEGEVGVRTDLEYGRLHRSSGDPGTAVPYFRSAAAAAEEAGLEELHVDALHMLVLVADPADQVALSQEALAVARAAGDPRARDWDASLLNNLGMTYADAGDFARALAVFEEALAARERIGDDGRTRVARWMVAWALRNLGRNEEALAMQTALKAELDSVGEEDPYVDEELQLLTSGGSTGP